MKQQLLVLLFLLTCTASGVVAQADKWSGTWQMSRKLPGEMAAITLELQIGAPDNGQLYPAKIKLQYGKFTGIYELLLVGKNDQQLGIGRGKYPLLETPYKLGIWLWYLNGTLDFNNAKIAVSRKWVDKFGIWMRGMEYEGDPDGDLWEHSKVALRDFLYRDSITLKKISNNPLSDSSVQRILHPEISNVYLGLNGRIMSSDSMVVMQVEDQEKYDRDTVTLLQNGKPLFSKEEVNDKNRRLNVRLDTGRNLFTFFADNLGGIPPNTGYLYMKIDNKEYNLNFSTRSNVFATFIVADIYHKPSENNNKLSSIAKGRVTTPVATIQVDTADIVLELWDAQREDGDSISLCLNGNWIATGFPVKNAPQTISARLQRGENTLLFMADNLGKIPPNTAALRIRYGLKTKTLRLSTDMRKNNEIKLILE
ncbi:hypothetical protein CLV51_103563 [Chitinophaga niastensis]|uniref:Uncharacterized protein n=1 Tax=Chitinophaga niastensis TaxID=536980 RepID=A0A2P8HK31_CHINA|nr:hypothetical protein [Chitinophaga niastensis]PSL46582.1 hypothetical protein CLV51_103563 [Chitinophaga niastensis]